MTTTHNPLTCPPDGSTYDLPDPFTIQHCTDWCESVGIDPDYIGPMVRELVDDGPDSTLSWPTIARVVGARFTDGIEYR